MEVDPPTPGFTFTPTSAYEANYMRAYGVEMCQDNGVAEVHFTAITTHQYAKQFTVSAEGGMTTDMDLSPARERDEVRLIHHAN